MNNQQLHIGHWTITPVDMIAQYLHSIQTHDFLLIPIKVIESYDYYDISEGTFLNCTII